MASRRQRRKAAAQQRHASAASRRVADIELADRVERLAYSRKQATEALGVSLATLDRRVVPMIATVATEWGGRLIPVSELERYLAERTQPPRTRPNPRARSGRKPSAPPEIVERVRRERAHGMTLAEIARRLNTEWRSDVAEWTPMVAVDGAIDPQRQPGASRSADLETTVHFPGINLVRMIMRAPG